jgi:hypothetical protein
MAFSTISALSTVPTGTCVAGAFAARTAFAVAPGAAASRSALAIVAVSTGGPVAFVEFRGEPRGGIGGAGRFGRPGRTEHLGKINSLIGKIGGCVGFVAHRMVSYTREALIKSHEGR